MTGLRARVLRRKLLERRYLFEDSFFKHRAKEFGSKSHELFLFTFGSGATLEVFRPEEFECFDHSFLIA